MNPIIQQVLVKRGITEAQLRREFRRKRVPVIRHPRNIERRYRVALRGYVSKLEEAAREIVVPALPELVRQAAQSRGDSAIRTDAWPAEVASLIDKLKIGVNKQTELFGPETTAQVTAKQVNAHNSSSWDRAKRSILGIDILQAEPWLEEMTESFLYENAALIKSLGDQSTERLEGIVQRGLRNGTRAEDIANEITKVYSVQLSRAKLIARDQVSKLNGQLTRTRQTNLGLRDYIWRTSEDEKVRPTHREKNGNRYSWDKPPADTGHPGEDVSCRCVAEAILVSMLD